MYVLLKLRLDHDKACFQQLWSTAQCLGCDAVGRYFVCKCKTLAYTLQIRCHGSTRRVPVSLLESPCAVGCLADDICRKAAPFLLWSKLITLMRLQRFNWLTRWLDRELIRQEVEAISKL